MIPAAALFEDSAGEYHVFVAGPEGRAHRMAVTLGLRTQEQAQVLSGVRPGDTVITSGGYALSDGLEVRASVTPVAGATPVVEPARQAP